MSLPLVRESSKQHPVKARHGRAHSLGKEVNIAALHVQWSVSVDSTNPPRIKNISKVRRDGISIKRFKIVALCNMDRQLLFVLLKVV